MAAFNLFELFGGKIFRIPDYQRGYAWVEKQLVELWDDIDELQIQPENGEFKKHYTGTIYLEETTPDDIEKWMTSSKFYNVVDGQQRLTTISIFIFELLKLSDEGYCGETKEDLTKAYLYKSNSSGNSTVYKFSYSNTDKNYNFLLKNIFENRHTILHDNKLNLYTKNLIEAKSFFATKLASLNHQQREILFKKLSTSLQFDIRTIEKDLDVQAVFETMNNRGKPLSTLEKLKNRLIYLTEKLANTNEDKCNLRKKINDAWGKIYIHLAQNPDNILDEDVFLSAHLSLYRKPKDAVFSEKLAEEKVFQMFCNKSDKYDRDESGEKEDAVSFYKIEDYVVKISDSAPIWFKLHNSKSLIINKILLLNSGKELKTFLLALLLKEDNEAIINQTLIKLEKIFFRNRVQGIGVMDERTTATWAREMYCGDSTIDEINEKIDNFIKTPIPNQNLIQHTNYLFAYERGNKGFHRWGTLKYFLFEYESYLKYRFRETNDKVSLKDYDITTIEHIIPQDCWDNWADVVNEFIGEIENEKKPVAIKVLLNTLGNLTILKNGKNSSLGKRSWIEKKERFRTGSYNEISISQNDNWTKTEILERGIDMLKFLEKKVDGLNFTENELKKMLFYDDSIIEKV